MQINRTRPDPMSDSGPDQDSSSSEGEQQQQQQQQQTSYAPRQINIHPSNHTTPFQPSLSAPAPEDHVKLRRDRKQRDFLFAGADEEELDRLLGSNKRKRRSNEHDDDDSEEDEEGGSGERKKGRAGRKKGGGSAESKGDGRGGEGGGHGKGREMTKDTGRGTSGRFRSTPTPRHCWIQSDEDKVLRWAEKYIAKSRTETTMREYAEKHLKHTFPDRTMESTYSKFKRLVAKLASSPRAPVASSSRRKEEEVELEVAEEKRDKPEEKRKRVHRRRDRSPSPVVVQQQQQHEESEFELESSPPPAPSMETDRKTKIEELVQQQHARTSSGEWFELGGAKIERPSMGGGSSSSSSFPVPSKVSPQDMVSRLVSNPPVPSTSSSRSEPSTSTSFPRTLKLRNFDHLVKDDDLRNLVSSFGRVVSAQVMRDPAGYSQGFGFVEFERAEDAQAAMKGLNGTMIRNKPLSIVPGLRPSPSSSSSAPRVAAPPLPRSSFRYDSYRPSPTDSETIRSPPRGPSQPARDPRDLPISSLPNLSSSSAGVAVPAPPSASLDTLATLTAALHANPSSLLSLVQSLNPAQPAAQSILALLASTSTTANFTTTSTTSTYAPSLRTDTNHSFSYSPNPSYGTSSSAPQGSTSHPHPSTLPAPNNASRDPRMAGRSDVSSGRT